MWRFQSFAKSCILQSLSSTKSCILRSLSSMKYYTLWSLSFMKSCILQSFIFCEVLYHTGSHFGGPIFPGGYGKVKLLSGQPMASWICERGPSGSLVVCWGGCIASGRGVILGLLQHSFSPWQTLVVPVGFTGSLIQSYRWLWMNLFLFCSFGSSLESFRHFSCW